ncbi:hypothetical protein LHJ74_31545 [Streptomyces sp. N2-109]|uniref:Metallopeptidase domain-containing protein n=2 Tax=Streptomyces TaxID=1883 RepID=A0ABT2K2S5_9ACTN|nr:hypothetical protein [Streptomyces gossypii]MCT2594391.1 hypothetical protein [Streptomyces gossypii]
MGARHSGTADPVERGYPHLETVRAAVTALYKRLSYDTVHSFSASITPDEVALTDDEELYAGVQRVARVMVQHLRLPDARMIVNFRDMEDAAHVELEAGPEYFVELNSRFKSHRRDIGAALAHEVMHVCLHRLGLAFPGTRDNEILTDTAAAYLGSGWLLLDAFRQDSLTSQKFGYLTPEEFGYVLAKRAALFDEDPAIWFTSPQAYEAYTAGRALARRDEEQPPLASSSWSGRRRYARDRRLALAPAANGSHVAPAPERTGYAFENHAHTPPRVSFPCPTCHQRIRVPVRGRVRARCGLCHTVLDCDT